MARRPGLIKRALIRQEQRTANEFMGSQAVEQTQAMYDKALAAAVQAAESGATPEELQPLRQVAGGAAVELARVHNAGIQAARKRGLSVGMPEIGQDQIEQKLAAFDSQVRAAVPNPERTGEIEGRQAGAASIAQTETELGRPLLPEERAALADVQGEGEGGPFAGTGFQAQSANTVITVGNKFRKGEALTDEEKAAYSIAYAELTAPRVVGSPTTGFSIIEPQLDPRIFLPPDQVGAQPIPGSEPVAEPAGQPTQTSGEPSEGGQRATVTELNRRQSPDVAGRTSMMQQATTNTRAIRDRIVQPDGSVNRQLMATMIFNLPSTEGRKLRAQFEDAASAKLRLETGAQANEQEIQNIMDRFMPSLFDNDETVKDKLDRMNQFFEDSLKNTDPELFEALTSRSDSVPEPPEDEPEAEFEGFQNGLAVFKRPDGTRFGVVQSGGRR